ncbi:LysE family translocator [Albidovulum sediminicola]|uniref:LysE family translocator n=1 Tax=Albidovulum sediminicola TaxID=2984331 RepID=A0ABT2Z528_9RHOB|nr:LysE family translocator [Defluviimonas sp. WL0075]MCV2866107.1 LysE family translocator [Defluviimonas sp. WL0075]
MTVTMNELWLYAGALAILWLTPGPVFVALTARSLSGGFRSAWPLAVGVTIGDIVWPLTAIFGLTWVVSRVDNLLTILHWVAAGIFLLMGAALIRTAHRSILVAEGRMTRPGIWPAFSAGLAAVIGNPKAVLFYMGVLPGFFDLSRVTGPDIAVILAMSALIPFSGNLLAAFAVGQARRILRSPRALWWINVCAGGLLVIVGVLIALL